MKRIRTSDTIPEILAMPERNRRERRAKAHHCRAIVRSGYFRKHGDITQAAPALQACVKSTYLERLRALVCVFASMYNDLPGAAEVREEARRLILGRPS